MAQLQTAWGIFGKQGWVTSPKRRSRYYTLRHIARFDDQGLWSHQAVCFSRYGTLLAITEAFVNRSPQGYFAHELADVLHAEVQDPLRDLFQQSRLGRQEVAGAYLYTSTDPATRRNQILARGCATWK